ncbi:hypothetical protein [Campylobacter ureolyticus]|uniref:hypothetical protein n=1 Tax=Campylobacter ureolyticus TaxID=827 RepID=UPI0026F028AF|nr:hypothetical protein [Campylobacter ureolyticus]
MIRTNYKINLQIDDETFELVINEPNELQKAELEKRANPCNEKLSKLQELNDKIALNEALIKTNENLVKDDKCEDKAKYLLENKTLLRENASYKKALSGSGDIKSITDELEVIYKYRTSLLINSDDKERLFKTLEAKGIKHELLWSEINKEILKENEKK